MSKNICAKFYPDWLSLRWVFKICRMQSMESQIYNGVDTCYLLLATCHLTNKAGCHLIVITYPTNSAADEKWQVSTVIWIGPCPYPGLSLVFPLPKGV